MRKFLAVLGAAGILAGANMAGSNAATPLNAPEAGFEAHNASTSARYTFINVSWAHLEPTKGSFTGPGWAVISSALAQNTAGVKLRLNAGSSAPAWERAASGPCVHVHVKSSTGSQSGCTPRWWDTSKPYWTDLQALYNAAAAKFGHNPKLLTVTACGAETLPNCEPFITSAAGHDLAALYNAGLNRSTDQAGILKSVRMVADTFPNQHVSLALHTVWNIPNAAGNTSTYSWPAERDVLNTLRATYGTHKLEFQDDGIGSAPARTWTGPYTSAPDEWSYIKNDPGRDGFQCGCKGVAGTTIMSKALNMHAEFMENIPPGLTSAQIAADNAAMRANATAPH